MTAGLKASYQVTNWGEYNESLVRRRDVTFWLDEDVIDSLFSAVALVRLAPARFRRAVQPSVGNRAKLRYAPDIAYRHWWPGRILPARLPTKSTVEPSHPLRRGTHITITASCWNSLPRIFQLPPQLADPSG